MATSYATLIISAREETRDMVYSNMIRQESLTELRDGTNTVFYLQNQNIVSGMVNSVQYGPWVTYGSNKRSLSTGAFPFTLDAVNSIITFSSAPDSGSTQPLFVDYYYQWFSDTDYTSWIDQATLELTETAGSFVGPVGLGGDLTPALIQLVVERFWIARASLYATKYATSSGGASEQVQTVTANYLKLAQQARAKANSLRKVAYVDPGQIMQPASATITTQPTTYTPKE